MTPSASDLSDLLELLAELVGGEHPLKTAGELVERFNGDVRQMHRAHESEIAAVNGVGQEAARRIKAAFALGLSLCKPDKERPQLDCAADAAALVQPEMGLLEQEALKLILLDVRSYVLDIVEVYRGTVRSLDVRIAEILRPAIRRNAVAIVLIHNHPSGGIPNPSESDLMITRTCVLAAGMMHIELLDHIVICGNSYASIKDAHPEVFDVPGKEKASPLADRRRIFLDFIRRRNP
jgi:DNA repair protein RadC